MTSTPLADLDGHDLIHELKAHEYSVIVTNTWKMENDHRDLVAIEQTRASLPSMKEAGDDIAPTLPRFAHDGHATCSSASPPRRGVEVDDLISDIRVLLYAGRPHWSKLATITPHDPAEIRRST